MSNPPPTPHPPPSTAEAAAWLNRTPSAGPRELAAHFKISIALAGQLHTAWKRARRSAPPLIELPSRASVERLVEATRRATTVTTANELREALEDAGSALNEPPEAA